MKAITTRYRGPTDTRGSRIIATDADGNRTSIPYPHELDAEEAHESAAVALCEKMHWRGCERLISGGTKDGYAHVFLPDDCVCPPKRKRGSR